MIKFFGNEEDEKIRQFLIHEVTETSDEIMSYRNMNKKDVLAWLKKKDEQKPFWSAEDEEMYKEVLTDIIYAKNDLKVKECYELSKRAMEAFNWFSNRYKSLRPKSTWKPSDEQFEALESATENCAYSEYQDCLRELIVQLKKLREE